MMLQPLWALLVYDLVDFRKVRSTRFLAFSSVRIRADATSQGCPGPELLLPSSESGGDAMHSCTPRSVASAASTRNFTVG